MSYQICVKCEIIWTSRTRDMTQLPNSVRVCGFYKLLFFPRTRSTQKNTNIFILRAEDPAISRTDYTCRMYGLSRNEGKKKKFL